MLNCKYSKSTNILNSFYDISFTNQSEKLEKNLKYTKRFASISNVLNETNFFLDYIFYIIPYNFRKKEFIEIDKQYKSILIKHNIRNEFQINEMFEDMRNYYDLSKKKLPLLNKSLKKIKKNKISNFKKILLKIKKQRYKIKEITMSKNEENLENIKILIKEYIQLLFFTHENIEDFCLNLNNLKYEQLLFLCIILKTMIKSTYYKLAYFLVEYYYEFISIFYMSEIEYQSIENTKIISKKLSNLFANIIKLKELCSPIHFINNSIINNSFSFYIHNLFLQHSQEIDKNHKIHRFKQNFNSNQKYKIKNAHKLIHLNALNFLSRLFFGLFHGIYDIAKLEGVNSFILYEIICFKILESKNKHLNQFLGEAISTLNSVCLNLVKNNFLQI